MNQIPQLQPGQIFSCDNNLLIILPVNNPNQVGNLTNIHNIFVLKPLS